MRRVEAEQNWERLRRRSVHNLAVQEVRLEGLQGFNIEALSIGRPIFAICGQNGSGKTVLLRAIMAVLRWSEIAKRHQFVPRLGGARLTVRIAARGEGSDDLVLDWRDVSAPVGDQSERPVIFLDPAQEVPRNQRFFQELQDLHDFIEAYGRRALNANARRTLSYVAQKQYESVSVTEIDDIEIVEGVPTGILPFFNLKEGGIEYDTRTASLGELSILTIYWKLSTCEPGSLVLIEEPETFLSEVSQAELIDMIVDQAASRDLTIIYSTHSPRLVRNLLQDEVAFLYRSQDGVCLADDETRKYLKQKLGYLEDISRLAIVEDKFAASFFMALCEKLDPDLLSEIEIDGEGGAQTLDLLRKVFPKRVRRVKVVYLYDGDMATRLGSTEKVFTLPGSSSPEEVLRSYISGHTDIVSQRISVPKAAFEMRLAELHGRDHHDWLPELAGGYGHSLDSFTRLVVDCWLTETKNRRTAKDLLDGVRAALY